MKLTLIAAVAVVLLLVGAYFVFFNNSVNPNATPSPSASVQASATNTVGATATPSAAASLDCAKIVSESDLKQVFGSSYSFSVEKQAQGTNQCVLYQIDSSLKGVNENKLWFGNVIVKELSEYDTFLNAINTAINISETNEVGKKSFKIDYLNATPYKIDLFFVENTGASVIEVYLLKLNVANKTIGSQITY